MAVGLHELLGFLALVAASAAVAPLLWLHLRHRRAIQAARHAYDTALAALRAEPTNAAHLVQVQDLHQAYVQLRRAHHLPTFADEVALVHDLVAALMPLDAAGAAAPDGASDEEPVVG